MDSFELNKIVAAVLIALLVIKGADLLSQTLICPIFLKEPAYKIAGVETSPSPSRFLETKGPSPIEPLLATANIDKGAEVFRKCTSCHTLEKGGTNRVGPNLYGVVGTQKASQPAYSYSSALKEKGGVWTYEELNHFLYSPRIFIQGTKMAFAGIKDDAERAAVIAYLRQHADNPLPLPPQ